MPFWTRSLEKKIWFALKLVKLSVQATKTSSTPRSGRWVRYSELNPRFHWLIQWSCTCLIYDLPFLRTRQWRTSRKDYSVGRFRRPPLSFFGIVDVPNICLDIANDHVLTRIWKECISQCPGKNTYRSCGCLDLRKEKEPGRELRPDSICLQYTSFLVKHSADFYYGISVMK